MADMITPTPWGILVDASTMEPIGPATREQWDMETDPDRKTPWSDGERMVYVSGGPGRLPCGHALIEHRDGWKLSLDRVLSATESAVDAVATASPESLEAPYVVEDVDDNDLLALSALLLTTLYRVGGNPSRPIAELFLGGYVRSAGLLATLHVWARGDNDAWTIASSLMSTLDERDGGAILAATVRLVTSGQVRMDDLHDAASQLLRGSDGE